MNGKFLRFKSKLFRIRLTKSIIAGISCGFVLSGLYLLMLDFAVIKTNWLLAIPIGALSAFVGFGVGFLLLKSSDENVAVDLDERFKLQEKVRTMLEFKDEKGLVLELQRKDAADELNKLPMRRLKFTRFWIYALCLLVGIVIMALGIMLAPEPEPPEEQPEVPFAISEKQIAQLKELIAEVKASDMESPYKESVALNLETLLFDLKQIELHREMVARVKETITDINKITDESECAEEIYDALKSQENDVANIIAEYLIAEEWADFSDISTRLAEAFKHSDEGNADVTADQMRDDTKKKLANTAAYVSLSLAFSGVSEDEALYKAFARLVNVDEDNEILGKRIYGVARIAEMLPSNTYEWSKTQIQGLLTVMQAEIYSAMEPEFVNRSVGVHATDELYRIFGITKPLEDTEDEKETSENFRPDDEKGDGASAGDGHVYPTNDKVYDINSDEQIIYGNLWALYYGEINNESDEEKKAIYNKYFMILYNGFDKEPDSSEKEE